MVQSLICLHQIFLFSRLGHEWSHLPQFMFLSASSKRLIKMCFPVLAFTQWVAKHFKFSKMARGYEIIDYQCSPRFYFVNKQIKKSLWHHQFAIIFYFKFFEQVEQKRPACSFLTFLERFVTSLTSRESFTNFKITITKYS